MNERHTYITYIAKSKTRSKEMQVIHFDQEVRVCGIFSNPSIFYTSLIMTFSLLNNCLRSMGYLSFSILWNLHVFHSFSSFLLLFWELHMSLFFQYSPILFVAYENFGEKDSWQMNGVFILGGRKTCFCVTLSVRVSIYLWVYVNLDHGCMTRISTRVTTIWQNSMWI